MPGLLVSVRSEHEARLAVAAGVAIVDVKEPDLGSLGRASAAVWAAVRAAIPASTPLSVALGELGDWDGTAEMIDWSGIAFRKLGFARAGVDWAEKWRELRSKLPGPPWVATIYIDWRAAGSPPPSEVIAEAISVSDCVGLLFDTWDKSGRSRIDEKWFPLVARAKAAGRLVTLAGGLDAGAISKLASLGPDFFAVRSAVCMDGNRCGDLDPVRLRELVALTSSLRL